MAKYMIEWCIHGNTAKRHLKCHSTCKEYLEEKEIYEKRKETLKAKSAPTLTLHDFNKNLPTSFRRHRGKR